MRKVVQEVNNKSLLANYLTSKLEYGKKLSKELLLDLNSARTKVPLATIAYRSRMFPKTIPERYFKKTKTLFGGDEDTFSFSRPPECGTRFEPTSEERNQGEEKGPEGANHTPHRTRFTS